MKPILKYFSISLLIFGGLIGAYYLLAYLSFSGLFDDKSSGTELKKQFIQNEKAIENLTNYFQAIIPNDEGRDIKFGILKYNRFYVHIASMSSPSENTKVYVGGRDYLDQSPLLDSLLSDLMWKPSDIDTLKKMLSKTGFDWVRTTQSYSNPIELYNNPSGWGNSSCIVFRQPLTKELIQIHGNPLSETGFGSRVVVSYSSAL